MLDNTLQTLNKEHQNRNIQAVKLKLISHAATVKQKVSKSPQEHQIILYQL